MGVKGSARGGNILISREEGLIIELKSAATVKSCSGSSFSLILIRSISYPSVFRASAVNY